MAGRDYQFQTLVFTAAFLEEFAKREFGASDRQRLLRTLQLLDAHERHPSLRVHELQGRWQGIWSASASDQLRITFERLEGGRKLLLTCSRHYQR